MDKTILEMGFSPLPPGTDLFPTDNKIGYFDRNIYRVKIWKVGINPISNRLLFLKWQQVYPSEFV